MKKLMEEKRKSNFKKTIAAFVIIFIISMFVGGFIYIDTTLRPTITVLAETKALEIANRAINKGVSEVVSEKINYEDLVDVRVDESGEISMIQANTIMMNDIASEVALEIQEEFKKVKSTTSYIPIGTALKSPILAKYGPQLKLSIEPIGIVMVDFKTSFESSGINQTRHTIYLEAKAEVKVVIPLTTTTKEVQSQVPICETIIVGDVPESYINIPEDSVENVLPPIDSKTN